VLVSASAGKSVRHLGRVEHFDETVYDKIVIVNEDSMKLYTGNNPIKFYRLLRRLTLEAAAQGAGLTEEYLCCIERGVERRWSVRLGTLADVLGVRLDEIVAMDANCVWLKS